MAADQTPPKAPPLQPSVQVDDLNLGMLRHPATGEQTKVLFVTLTLALPFDAEAAQVFGKALIGSSVITAQPGQVPGL